MSYEETTVNPYQSPNDQPIANPFGAATAPRGDEPSAAVNWMTPPAQPTPAQPTYAPPPTSGPVYAAPVTGIPTSTWGTGAGFTAAGAPPVVAKSGRGPAVPLLAIACGLLLIVSIVMTALFAVRSSKATELADDLRRSQTSASDARSQLTRAENDLSSARSDLSSARSDASKARSDLNSYKSKILPCVKAGYELGYADGRVGSSNTGTERAAANTACNPVDVKFGN